MTFTLLLIPLFLVIYCFNLYREKKNKKPIPEGIIFPVGMLIIMCVVAYELSAPPSLVLVFSFFGAIIGSMLEKYLK